MNKHTESAAKSKRLTPSMLDVLHFINEGRTPYTGCSNRSESGARTCVITALRRRGLLVGDELTDAGRAALAKAQGGAK